MKLTKSLVAMLALAASVAFVIAADPTPIEDACTTSATHTNELGRSYDIEGIYVKSRGNTTSTATVAIAVSNTQDTDLTGTNATQTAIVYTVKSSGVYSNGWDWTADELIRVPIGSLLTLTFTGGLTNDYLIFRDNSDD